MFRGLINKFKAVQDKNQRIAQFRDAFNIAASDGVLTEAELQDLEATMGQLDLTNEDIHRLKLDLANDVIDKAIDDRRVSQEEQYGILEFLRRFNVPSEPLAEKIDQLTWYRNLFAIEQGHLPVLVGTTIIPKKGEAVHYRAHSSTIEDKVISTQYVGASHGVSLRVMKGVSYRVGASRGQKVEQRATVATSTGTVYLTNQRVVYDSATKPMELKLDKLVNMQVYGDGIMLGVSNRKVPVFFKLSPQDAEGFAVTLSAVINQANA